MVTWAEKVDFEFAYLSVVTIEEIEIGVLRVERRDAKSGSQLRSWLNIQVLESFRGRILPIDTLVAQKSASLLVPDPKPTRDALIAATALIHGLTVVTRNVKDFSSTGVKLYNPWN